MHPFGDALVAGDIEGAIAQMAEDVVLHSPVTFRPYHGRDATETVIRAVAEVLYDFRYVRTLASPAGQDHALVFNARIGDREIEGCDFLEVDENGMIKELTVMVRPLSGALALAEAMRAELAAG